MHLVDSLGRHSKLRFICNLHEQGTAVAVDAYAQARGFGAGLVTTGPGGTNALTGVAAAWVDSSPCLFISGQVKRADLRTRYGVRQLGFQEIDIVSMVKPITKYAVTVMDPAEIRLHLDKAIFEARHGRPGPVWIDIPLDVQAAEIEPESLEGFIPPPHDPAPSRSDLTVISKMVADLRCAHRPVLLLGNGVRHADALPNLERLLERLGIPVLLTWKAADFLDEAHPLFAGRPGAIGQRAANFAQQASDWFLAIGARLDLGQTAYTHATFAPSARKYVVDLDPSELQKLSMPLEAALSLDAKAFLEAFERIISEAPLPDFSPWLAQIHSWRKRYPVLQPKFWEEAAQVNPYVLVEVLSELVEEGDLLVPGSSGACSELTCQAWKLRKGLRMLNSQGLGPMGFGVPAALGACVALGRRRTICIDGDGGFHMNLQELEVIRRLGLPIKFFVLDNEGYGSIRSTQRSHFGGHYVASDVSSSLTLPDAAAICRAYGIPSVHLESHVDLRERCHELLKAPGPAVAIVHVPKDHLSQPRCISRKLPNGSMETCPMEDLWPFLEREELDTVLREARKV